MITITCEEESSEVFVDVLLLLLMLLFAESEFDAKLDIVGRLDRTLIKLLNHKCKIYIYIYSSLLRGFERRTRFAEPTPTLSSNAISTSSPIKRILYR